MKLEGRKLCMTRRISAHPPKTQQHYLYCYKVALYLSCWQEIYSREENLACVEVEKLNAKLSQKPKA